MILRSSLLAAAAAIFLGGSAFAQSCNITAPGTAPGCLIGVQGNSSGTPIPFVGTAGTAGTVLGNVFLSSQYPTNAATPAPVPETISATGTTTAFTATLAAAAGKTTYICGAEIDAVATAGLGVAATITGTITGTLNFVEMVGTLTNSAGSGRNSYNFNPCIPASAANTTIVVNAGAAGSGGVASISAWGFQE